MRVFGSDSSGIVSGIFDPKARTLKKEKGTRLRGPAADPSVRQRLDGSYVMILKRFSDVD